MKCPAHCAEQFLELKICISPQFRAIDPPNPAGGFIQQNENVRFATAACMQKYGNVRFATVACAKCMRYGGREGGTIPWGGVATRDTEPYIGPKKLQVSSRFWCLETGNLAIVLSCWFSRTFFLRSDLWELRDDAPLVSYYKVGPLVTNGIITPVTHLYGHL